jgi:hypothetical protein
MMQRYQNWMPKVQLQRQNVNSTTVIATIATPRGADLHKNEAYNAF